MAEINKPSDINKIWAENGDVVAPSDVKIDTGWEVEVPPRQYFNYIDNKQDQFNAHVNQHGIPVWDNVTEYQANKSYVQGSDGVIYIAVQTHTNQNPTTDTADAYWKEAFARGQTTIQAWSSTVNYPLSSYVIGSNGIIYFSLQVSGPSTTVRNPISEPNYWQQYAVRGQVTFSAAGVTVWDVPLAMQRGIIKPKVKLWGAGGGGSYTGAAGGGYSEKIVDLTGVTNVTITIGAGGIFSSTETNNGGTTSFGAIFSATGGNGGAFAGGTTDPSRPAGGNGIGGDLNITGAPGQSANRGADGGTAACGGPVRRGATDASNLAQSGLWPGGGSGGRAGVSPHSGAGIVGADGGCVIEW